MLMFGAIGLVGRGTKPAGLALESGDFVSSKRLAVRMPRTKRFDHDHQIIKTFIGISGGFD